MRYEVKEGHEKNANMMTKQPWDDSWVPVMESGQPEHPQWKLLQNDETGILAENTQGHMDTPSRSVLSLLVPSRLCFGSQRTFHGLTSLTQQLLRYILLYSLRRGCTALVSSHPHDSFYEAGKPPLVPTSQRSRIQGPGDCEFGGRALMEPDPTLPSHKGWNDLVPVYIFGLILCHCNRLIGLLPAALPHIKASAHVSLLPRVNFLSTLRSEHPCAKHFPDLPAQLLPDIQTNRAGGC
nr:uncharacterized protein LOC110134389 isoform X2 [Odocoileus virginianus texanus]